MFIENSLTLSTDALREERLPRYVSAEHAVDHYLRLALQCGGLSALDYRSVGLFIQHAPPPEPGHIRDLSTRWELEAAFSQARDRSLEEDWTVWCEVRIHHRSYREIQGWSKTTVGRKVERVDGRVEEALAERRMLARHRMEHAANIKEGA
ncbi:hypothetical protein DV096_20490 [Bradymonadaceae bacterium TMQ3]|uniref:Uncharacterized protein n=1 Tax=Lujinxingia sediminis TaxID=2480984 RepID=A0ABY0CQQ7_9DELT|nr:hypothetical protein [Lujinxingia sediminis]RDV36164.1 hypothetical protein DV096_20490 [Bradymonadaceae bacterium TMQ3]RVU42703.1 hypothetical protein EA187_14395 [Lujinxingia sediminis]TXC67607.1 hypothetical protein FRC91_20265 [Bradymonadales bacterium TMQ1]